MVRVSLSLGIIATIAGLMAIGFGIPIQAFGLGNTLIVSGSTVFSAGLIVIVLSMVLRAIDRLSLDVRRPVAIEPSGHASFEAQPVVPPAEPLGAPSERPGLPRTAPDRPPPVAAPHEDVAYADRPEQRHPPMPPTRGGWQDTAAAETVAPPPGRSRSAPPRLDQVAPPRSPRELGAPTRLDPEAGLRPRGAGRMQRFPHDPVIERPQQESDPELRSGPDMTGRPAEERSREAAADPYAPPERRRVFGWTRRSKDRSDDAGGRSGEGVQTELGAGPGSAVPAGRMPSALVESQERPRLPSRGHAPPEPRERPPSPPPPPVPPPAAEAEEPRQPVEVLKQGTVDGMSYTLYTDGSIDAEFPDGRIRFDSIDDLRQHLESQG